MFNTDELQRTEEELISCFKGSDMEIRGGIRLNSKLLEVLI